MTEARNTLEAELKGFVVYVITPKRVDVKKLLSDVPSLFSPGTFENLPDIARYDLTQAGTCTAYENSTAAGFHLMRATEAVLRAFYRHHVTRGHKESLWGPIVKDLRRRRKFTGRDQYTALFNNLDNIRASFRNPTQHPEKIYDIHEAQDLWGLCIDVINRMAKDLIRK
jgi:hypothetical protein